jgi:competence protein ComEC
MAKSFNNKLNDILKIVTVALCVTVTFVSIITVDNRVYNLTSRTANKDDSFVRMIDVGQGDSILLYSNGYSALIDTGPAENATDLVADLHSIGIEIIDVLILTHLHLDHTGGVTDIYDHFQVENLLLPGLSTFSEGIYSAQLAIDKMTRKGKGVYSAEDGMRFKLGEIEVEIVANYYDSDNENNRSLIIKALLDSKSFLFMADAESQTEKMLIAQNKDIDCDVLKVGHHGSSTSTIKAFLEIATPEIALISVGKKNIYNHPHNSTTALLKKFGCRIYRTDKDGSITVKVENNKIKVEKEK